MTTHPGADELELRARLHDLGVAYAPAPVSRPRQAPGEEGHLEPAAPAAEESPLQDLRAWLGSGEEEPAAPAAPQGSPRLPDWWAPHRPDLAAEEKPAEQAAPEEEPDVPAAAEDQEQPEPSTGEETTPAGRPGLRDRVRTWVESVEERTGHRPTPGDAGDTEAGDKEPGEDTGDAAGDGPKDAGPVRKVPHLLRRSSRPRKAPRPRRRPRFAAPGIPHTMRQDRRSLVEIIRNTPDHVRWMTYSGSALATGFWLGWPQWVMDGTAYLATERTPTDGYSLTCYGLAGGVFLLDAASRQQRLPLAWSVRVASSSLVAGVLMYGDPTPISQMF